jgi:hypothetical protein
MKNNFKVSLLAKFGVTSLLIVPTLVLCDVLDINAGDGTDSTVSSINGDGITVSLDEGSFEFSSSTIWAGNGGKGRDGNDSTSYWNSNINGGKGGNTDAIGNKTVLEISGDMDILAGYGGKAGDGATGKDGGDGGDGGNSALSVYSLSADEVTIQGSYGGKAGGGGGGGNGDGITGGDGGFGGTGGSASLKTSNTTANKLTFKAGNGGVGGNGGDGGNGTNGINGIDGSHGGDGGNGNDGGNGGAVSINANTINADTINVVGANGANGGDGGNGGNGGDDFTGSKSGGNGGNGNGGGNGGNGGVIFINAGIITASSLSLSGGNGGNGGVGGNGGNGGSSNNNGKGGNGGNGGVGGNGGNGTSVELYATTVIVDSLLLASGVGGENSVTGTDGNSGILSGIGFIGSAGIGGDAGNGGIGGNVSFETHNLRAQYIDLTKSKYGSLSFTVGTLHVFEGDSIYLQNIRSDDFSIDKLLFDITGVLSGSTMLSISGVDSDINILNSDISLTLDRTNPLLEAGYTVDLIKDTSNSLYFTIFGNTSLDGTTLQAKQGISLIYDFEVNQDANTLSATVKSDAKLNPQTKTLTEGFIGGFASVREGQDIIADMAINNVMYIAQSASDVTAFALSTKGKSQYTTGSHVDVNTLHLLTGFAFNSDLNDLYGRSLTTGVFFEGGNGDYKTENDFSTTSSLKSKGNIKYYGLGTLARFGFSPSELGRLYIEGAIRGGQAKNNFHSDDLTDSSGVKAEYDVKGLYYGMHMGTGYIFNLADDIRLELYGKYLYLHQNGDSDIMPTGDKVTFNDINSQRLKGGLNFYYTINEFFTPYIGIAYEQEFDGEGGGRICNFDIEAPSLKGGSTIGELDFTITPSRDSSFFIDLNLKGYIGQREGLAGTLKLEYGF